MHGALGYIWIRDIFYSLLVWFICVSYLYACVHKLTLTIYDIVQRGVAVYIVCV